MTPENHIIFQKFKGIRSWRKGDVRAPHKPLLVLLAIGKTLNGRDYFTYEEIEDKLEQLLEDFGPPRNQIRPFYPFVRLASDDIWIFSKPNIIESNKDYSRKYLKDNAISAGFPPEITNALRSDHDLTKEIIYHFLNTNFPESYHDEILIATGLHSFADTGTIIRDPKFREKILIAYNYQCAVCGWNIRLGNKLVGLEAAHIKWHQAGGPANENNGLALCSGHHKLLDAGVFTLDDNYRVKVAENANGNQLEELLLRFEGKNINLPRKEKYYPEQDFVSWHVNEVFREYRRK